MMRIRDAARHSQIAVSFGYIERAGDALFSSQMVIDASGAVIHNFHRVSVGWKEYWHTDGHYREGATFEAFSYLGKRLAIALCGDLWTEGRPRRCAACVRISFCGRCGVTITRGGGTRASNMTTPGRPRCAATAFYM